MKCEGCYGTGIILSCDREKGSKCRDRMCEECDGTGESKKSQK